MKKTTREMTMIKTRPDTTGFDDGVMSQEMQVAPEAGEAREQILPYWPLGPLLLTC